MFNPEKLLGGLVSGALGGGRSRRRGGRAALAMGALGVAVAAVEHFMENRDQGQTARTEPSGGPAPPPPPGAGRTPDKAPPPPPPSGQTAPASPPPPPSTAAPAAGSDPILLIRAMIASAHSDGRMDADERTRILNKLEAVGLDDEERAFLETELDHPRDPAELAAGAKTPESAKQIYAVSIMAVDVDSEAERNYLRKLAGRLGLSEKQRAEVHDLLEEPLF